MEHVVVDERRVSLPADGVAEGLVVFAAEAEDPRLERADRRAEFGGEHGVAGVLLVAQRDGSQSVEGFSVEQDAMIEDGAASTADLDFAFAAQIHRAALTRLKAQWQTKLHGEAFDRLRAVALGNKENPGYAPAACTTPDQWVRGKIVSSTWPLPWL